MRQKSLTVNAVESFFKQKYREANRKVKRLARRKKLKREALDKLAAKAQDAAQKLHQGSVYRITNHFCGKTREKQCRPIKDKDG